MAEFSELAGAVRRGKPDQLHLTRRSSVGVLLGRRRFYPDRLWIALK
jgi:hypothetical protein